jgi:teichuronic acid biosynthesis glycosyltransferase TuaC
MIKSIIIVTDNFPNAAEPYRGIYVLEQLREIAKEYDVHVLVPVNIATRLAPALLLHEREKNIDGIHVHYIKYPYSPVELLFKGLASSNRGLHRKLNFWLLLRKAKHLNKTFTFKLVHGHEVMIGDLAMPLGEKLGIKTIFTIHSLREENIRYFGARSIATVVENLQRADQLIAVSSIARNEYADAIDISKIKVVYNGFDATKLKYAEQRKISCIALLSVCGLVPLKKIDLVLHALKEIKSSGIDFQYRIVGGGPKGFYQSLIKQLGLQENVELIGSVPPEDIYQYYRDCDIFVLPSVRESFGIVFLEAMYCEKPIICSSNSGIAEIIENGKHGFIVRHEDVNDLKTKMTTLMQDEALRRKMGHAGKELAANYSIEKQTNEILLIYRALTECAS